MKKKTDPPPRYNRGDWVSFRWGGGTAIGQVIEQRGPLIGPERMHLYTIRHEREELEPDLHTITEDELEPVSPPPYRPGHSGSPTCDQCRLRSGMIPTNGTRAKRRPVRPEELAALLRNRPFAPLRLHMLDGRTYDILNPERVLVLRDRIDVGVAPDPATGVYDRVDQCPLPYVARVEQLAATVTTGDAI